MQVEKMIHSIQTKLTFEESQQLVEAIKNNSNQVLDLLSLLPEKSPNAFIRKLLIFFEREKYQAGIDNVDSVYDLEKIPLGESDEFSLLLEELSQFNESDIIQVLTEVNTLNLSPHGHFLAVRLVQGLIDFLSVEDFENLISYEDVHHLY